MGTFTDNLLKLTEFPFSYSLISLFALIRYGESFLKIPIEALGPLLILIGFFATTLSITDPIGALQKVLLRGLRGKPAWRVRFDMTKTERLGRRKGVEANELRNTRIFGVTLRDWGLNDQVLASLSPIVLTYYRKVHPQGVLNEFDNAYIYITVLALRDSTLRTRWVVREIDKITSMFYFIIVILTFISALYFIPSLENKFVVTFQAGNEIQGGSINDTNITTSNTNTAGGSGLARIIILALSIGALFAILYIFLSVFTS